MKLKMATRLLSIITLMTLSASQAKPCKPAPELNNLPVIKRELRILTWNIYMLPFCSEIHQNSKRAKGIANQISGFDYDIIVFEEAFDHQARNILRSQLTGCYPYMYGPANDSFLSLRTNSGVWVLSKIPLRMLEQIKFQNRFGIDALARKGAVLFEGQWQGQSFQLLGTHLQADSPDTVRRGQCLEIADKLLRKYAADNIPQIVCGDFNIEIDDPKNYGYMLKVLEAENGGLQGDVLTSFDEVDNRLAKKENGKKRLIDYVLLRNSKLIKDINRRVLILREYQKNIVTDLSDHYGIEAVINFDSPAPQVLTLLNK